MFERRRTSALLLLLPLAIGCADEAPEAAPRFELPPPPPGAEYDGLAFTIDTVAPGVYHARGTGALVVGSNASIVEGDDELLVVDTQMTPAGAWALRRELGAVTDKPIMHVVNSHFHFDHSGGNQIYGAGVEIIGHTFTRQMMEAGYAFDGRSYRTFLGGLAGQIEQLRATLDTVSVDSVRVAMGEQLRIQEQFARADSSIVATPPTVTLDDRLAVDVGGRNVQVLHVGRGHTAGDVVVYLPDEDIMMTGDLITGGLPFMGDAFVNEWGETLRALTALDIALVLPGHGPPFTGTTAFEHLAAYMDDLWTQVTAQHAAGASVAEAADAIDMSAHNASYQNPQAAVNALTIQRIYDLLTDQAEGREFFGEG